LVGPETEKLGPEARLGAALRRAREEQGISLRALAKKLYRAHSNLVEYERGHRLAPVDVVKAYETHLSLTPGTLVTLQEGAHSELCGEDIRPGGRRFPSFPPQLALHQLPAKSWPSPARSVTASVRAARSAALDSSTRDWAVHRPLGQGDRGPGEP